MRIVKVNNLIEVSLTILKSWDENNATRVFCYDNSYNLYIASLNDNKCWLALDEMDRIKEHQEILDCYHECLALIREVKINNIIE